MAIRNIREYGDPILEKKCKEVTLCKKDNDMVRTFKFLTAFQSITMYILKINQIIRFDFSVLPLNNSEV